MNTAASDFLLIGIDGGATEVKVHAVQRGDGVGPASYELGVASASRKYDRLPGFAPQPVEEQLAQQKTGSIGVSPDEHAQGALWVEAACAAIREVAATCGAVKMLVGIGMPGLKTPDGRGICVINNGPRIPDYLDQLEQGLGDAGLELASPVATLGSDADYCGLGEEYAVAGLFREVDNAYYVGGGTGLADALKLHGDLVPFDRTESWLLKSWQIHSGLGPTFEKLVSAKSLNERYAELTSAEADERAEDGYPECEAAEGKPIASAWMDCAALALSELMFERLDTIRNGRGESPHRSKAYLELTATHPYRGTMLDRVVIGQRIGQIYGSNRFHSAFGQKVDTYLAALIAASGSPELAAGYLAGGRLKPGSSARQPCGPPLLLGLQSQQCGFGLMISSHVVFHGTSPRSDGIVNDNPTTPRSKNVG